MQCTARNALASFRRRTAGVPAEAANCLSVLLEGDTTLQAQCVEDGMLPLTTALLKDKPSAAAATRLLGTLDECFEDMVAAAK